jgi:hypothetical protein
VTVSTADRIGLKESMFGATGNDCSCQEGVNGDAVECAWLEDDATDRVEVEERRPMAGLFAKTWDQLLMRPDGLLRIVGRTSSDGSYALVRFKRLDKRKGESDSRLVQVYKCIIPRIITAQGDSLPTDKHEVIGTDFSWGLGFGNRWVTIVRRATTSRELRKDETRCGM